MRGHRLRRRLPRNYAEQTYASPYALIRYPHRRRYALTVETIGRRRPRSLLDYGAGDGHVLAELESLSEAMPERVVAYDPVPDAARLARVRLARTAHPDRFQVVEDLAELGEERFDMVICLGVLEHMPLPERERFYTMCARYLAPRGTVLIDVPVEVGLSLALKEGARVALKGRALKYSPKQLTRAVLGGVTFDPARFAADASETWIQDHTGFDYRLFEQELRARFSFVRSFGSPFPQLPAGLLNQEMFYLLRL
jgi:2-polyprenyl-3-methyl-5-hydroxy-6-metoxy-1,4-benzoquinol methylase